VTARRALCQAAAALLGVVAALGCSPAASSPAVPPPWPQRPVVDLSYDMSGDLSAATGTETVRFTPDEQVCELDFRSWTNAPTTAAPGNALEVVDAAVDGRPVGPQVQSAGAPSGAPGTLVVLPLPVCVPAATAITANLTFRLTLASGGGERVGHSAEQRTAWLGTAFPLLAWVRGQGWVRDPAVDMDGETVTSEEFRLRALRVTADDGLVVTATGTAEPTGISTPGRTTHTFTADSVRDVAVAIGDYRLAEQRIGEVRVHLATPRAGTRVAPQGWMTTIATELDALQRQLGPFPYPDLWATIVPGQSDGVEFPMSIQLGDRPAGELPALLAHEIAHQWFYSLVGNDQARDPWLDEAFATFAEAVATGSQDQYRLGDVPRSLLGDVGKPMSYWAADGSFDRYVRGVYDQGAAVLLAARQQTGADRFDAALRVYVSANAHRVAAPIDVVAAFAALPGVDDMLRRQGAFR
jgi:Peptidase family M1 domain